MTETPTKQPNIPLYYDSLFKEVMVRHPDILFAFVKDILDYIDIKFDDDIEGIVPGYELLPTKRYKKIYRSDLLVKINNSFYIAIEVNSQGETDYFQRNNVMASMLYQIATYSGIRYKDLDKVKVILVNINKRKNKTNKAIEVGDLKDRDTNKTLSKTPFVVNLSIAKCKKLYYTGNYESKDDKLIRWMVAFQERDFDKIYDIMGKEVLMMEQQQRLIKQLKDYNAEDALLDDDFIELMHTLKEIDIEQSKREREEELKELTWENMAMLKASKKGFKKALKKASSKQSLIC